MGRLFLVAVLLLATATVGPARADAVVTLCQSDDQLGPGTNLTTALLGGGNITFQCGGAATIRITHAHEIALSTAIDGGGSIILDGRGTKNMFAASQADISIRLDRLTLHGAHELAAEVFGTVLQADAKPSGVIRVVISRSQIDDSTTPLHVRSGTLNIEDSRFLNNRGVSVIIGGGNARLDISRSIFQNAAIPVLFTGSEGNTVVISDSQFDSNQTSLILNEFEGGAGCSLTIVRSHFSGNTGRGSSRFASGGALRTSCDTTIRNSEFLNNSSSGEGGAIYLETSTSPEPKQTPTLSLRAVKFAGNNASRAGGAIAVQPSDTAAGVLSLQYVTFTSNRANLGGAIDLGSPVRNPVELRSNGVTFSKNLATADGGAIYGGNATLNLTRGVFVQNKAGGFGGAIAISNSAGGHSVLANSLFVQNESGAGGSAFYGADVHFINSTITANLGTAILMSSGTPNLSAGQSKAKGSIRFTNSIIADNRGGNCSSDSVIARAVYLDGGHNLQFPSTECGASIPADDPHLDTMYIPIVGSRALAGGDNQVCMADPINAKDVYGQRRPQGPVCTIGAAEGDIQHLLNKLHVKQPDPSLGPGSPTGGPSGEPPKPTGEPPKCSYCCCKQ
jgi:predicted outer membrane repeat protein